MMNKVVEPKWITENTVIAIHDRQIAEFGGATGVRDIGLLQSALGRPQNAFHYNQDVSLTKLAGAYAYGIAKNHAFIDGNKRTALMTSYLFLLKNGFVINATEEERFISILSLANDTITEEEFVGWLNSKVAKES